MLNLFYNLLVDGKDNPIWSANTNNSCTRAPGAEPSKDQEYKIKYKWNKTYLWYTKRIEFLGEIICGHVHGEATYSKVMVINHNS